MRPIKSIYNILLALLVFYSSVEFCKYSSDLNFHNPTQELFSASDIPQIEFDSFCTSKDIKAHFTIKKKVKSRVEDSQTRFVKNLYHTHFFNFKILKEKIIYGIAEINELQQQIHLHLYHLF